MKSINRIRKPLFAAASVLGVALIALMILFVTEISPFSGGVVAFSLNDAIESVDVTVDGQTLVTVGGDPHLVFESPRDDLVARYIEINIEEVEYPEGAIDATMARAYFATEGINFAEEMSTWYEIKEGRNFIDVPEGVYSAIRVDPTPYAGATFKVRSIGLLSAMPLRFRHVIALGVFSILWTLICRVLFFSNLSLVTVRLFAFKKYSFLLFNLVKKDFTTKYRRSVLGVLWSVLNPLLMALVISAVFNNIFRFQIENFAAYFLTGSLIFNLMSEATNGSISSVLGAAGLIKKVYIPKYIFPVEKCLFALVNTVFNFIATVIILPFIGVALKPTVLLFWVPLIYVLVFCAGFGMLLSAANIFFRDIGHLYSVWVTAWMYLTPVIYPAELIPDGIKWFVNANPMFYYVSYFRDLMMYNTIPDFKTNIICASFAGAFFVVGLIVFKKTQDRFILHV